MLSPIGTFVYPFLYLFCFIILIYPLQITLTYDNIFCIIIMSQGKMLDLDPTTDSDDYGTLYSLFLKEVLPMVADFSTIVSFTSLLFMKFDCLYHLSLVANPIHAATTKLLVAAITYNSQNRHCSCNGIICHL